MTCLRRAAFWGCLFAGVISTALPGCSYFGNGRKSQEVARAQSLFQTHCGGCHNGKKLMVGKQPPLLYGIFQRPSLPSGAPATDAQVRSTILGGRSGIMPAFQNDLDSQDTDDIIKYLHTLKASQKPESSDPGSR
jgi:mono/diheme cytochrome c family protein